MENNGLLGYFWWLWAIFYIHLGSRYILFPYYGHLHLSSLYNNNLVGAQQVKTTSNEITFKPGYCWEYIKRLKEALAPSTPLQNMITAAIV